MSVLDHRPIAVSGSRDFTLRVWDIDTGHLLRVLEGHQSSVRCMDAHGSIVVSGSYDNTLRVRRSKFLSDGWTRLMGVFLQVWDVDTGLCLHILRGHLNNIYCVSYDGIRIASGGLDTHVRIWDPNTGSVAPPFHTCHSMRLRGFFIGPVWPFCRGTPPSYAKSNSHPLS